MYVQDQPAYILHHRAYRDTSQILEIVTPDYGRLSLMSRGSKSATSKIKGILQPFQPLMLGWTGRGEMPTLTQVEPQITKANMLSGKGLPSAFYINELLMRLMHKNDVQSRVYYLYESILQLLAGQHEVEPVLRMFEKKLLEALGFGLNLSLDARNNQIILAEGEYAYYLELGPVSMFSVIDEAYLLKLSGKSLLDLEHNKLNNAQSLKDAKCLMRMILNHYLEGKPIKSRELFR